MRIYVSHKNGMPDQDLFYKTLEHTGKHVYTFPHKNSSKPYTSTRELFENKDIDLVLAEVSEPSTGQGIELGWANAFGIPVVCVFKDSSKPAQSLSLISGRHYKYSNFSELSSIVEKELI